MTLLTWTTQEASYGAGSAPEMIASEEETAAALVQTEVRARAVLVGGRGGQFCRLDARLAVDPRVNINLGTVKMKLEPYELAQANIPPLPCNTALTRAGRGLHSMAANNRFLIDTPAIRSARKSLKTNGRPIF
jgi:hypothetical protein